MTPPSAPWVAATAILPLTVARTTVVNLRNRWVFLALAQRDQLAVMTTQLHAIAQQEEQHVQHDAQADQELEGVLADVQGLFRQELAALHGKLRELLLQGCKVMQTKTSGKIRHARGQGIQYFLQVGARIELTAIHQIVQRGDLLNQGNGNQDDRNNDDQNDDQQTDQGR